MGRLWNKCAARRRAHPLARLRRIAALTMRAAATPAHTPQTGNSTISALNFAKPTNSGGPLYAPEAARQWSTAAAAPTPKSRPARVQTARMTTPWVTSPHQDGWQTGQVGEGRDRRKAEGVGETRRQDLAAYRWLGLLILVQ